MNTPGYKSHISSAFNAELEDVRQRVLAMGGLVEQQLVDATRALIDLDGDLAGQLPCDADADLAFHARRSGGLRLSHMTV